MSTTPNLDRRTLLRNGGIVVSMGALIAACGANRGGSTDPGRLGVAATVPQLDTPDIDDTILLRTAQSLEFLALEVYSAAAALGVMSNAETTLAQRCADDHTEHAAAIGALVSGLGSSEFTCANPFLMDRAVTPLLAAIEDGDDPHRDIVALAHAIETLVSESYQAFVASLSDPELRGQALMLGAQEARHAAAWALSINPGAPISPAVYGEPVENDADGFPVPYAIPATFGPLTGLDVVVGPLDAEGARFTVKLQTPAANTFVYPDQTC